MAVDPYCYPNTNVLINLGDLREKAALNQFESDAVFLAMAAMQLRPLRGPFNLPRLLETHRRIFGRVYPWAGELRTGIGMLAKNRSGFTVAYGPSANVPAALEADFAKLQAENELRGLEDESFLKRLAYFYSELDAVHPFREGNSRTLRAFFSDLAQAAGHRLDWSLMGLTEDARQRLHHARDIAVMRGDLGELLTLLRLCLQPR